MEKRNTIQKQLVLDAVRCLGNHPTAERVYEEVIMRHPSVSKATVYRNLSSLAEDGAVRHIGVPGGADRFDHTMESHHHIQCRSCGAFSDASLPSSAEIDALVAKETGFKEVCHDIIFMGVCPSCAAKPQQ